VKKGLLILCYNINEPNWEHTVWGTPPDKPGRLVRGAAVILEEGIDLAILVSSAFGKEGKSSGQLMKEHLYQGIEGLSEFTIYPLLRQISSTEIRRVLDERLMLLEEPVKNTAEEVMAAAKVFKDAGIEKTLLITNPDHISRTIKDAIVAWQKDYPELAANVYGAPCVTLYSERTPEDVEIAKVSNVVIAEPLVMKKFNLARMFGILGNSEALAEVDAVLKKYGK